MNAKGRTQACASSDMKVNWNQINWDKANQHVKRLQARIVKATREGRWNRVESLQWLLTHSFYGKALAVRRVTENRGAKTAGVDGKIWATPTEKAQAILSLMRRGYKPLPLRRVYIPKANGKKRPLGIPAMKDRAMQALHLLALDPVSETTADSCSYGFRKERCTADAISHCFVLFGRRTLSPEWVLEGDIKGCFDNISHEWLISNIPMDKGILKKWLESGLMEEGIFQETTAGTPQGGIISPVLANMTLDGLQDVLRSEFAASQRRAAKNKVCLVRYADDFVISGISRELLENKVMPLLEGFLKERGLTLSREKTKITHITEGFDFLGQNIRRYRNGKLLIMPSKRNVRSMLTQIRQRVRKRKAATQQQMIEVLNPVIRGWAFYHRHVVASRTFHRVDHELWALLWRWARRRHPNKSLKWIRKKYFSHPGTRRWHFGYFTGRRFADGKMDVRTIQLASDIPIRRHRLIIGQANPYDPRWEEYFESRWDWKMMSSVLGTKKLRYIWKQQNGICPACNSRITLETGWDTHHRIPRALGGSDRWDNLSMLHPQCHDQWHAQLGKVADP
jgi:RNA-directed DNA polymerase